MRTWLKVTGGIAVVDVSFVVTLAGLEYASPRCPNAQRFEMKRPFQKIGTFSFVKEGLSEWRGDTPVEQASRLTLCEDGWPLGPAHAAPGDIAKVGKGRFSYWGSSIVFSTSDNSDPNTNGRTYEVVQPR